MNLRHILNALLRPTGYEIARTAKANLLPADFAVEDWQIINGVRPYTMAKTVERIFATIDATRYVITAGIPGSIVECGVWRGGMMMAAARMLLALGELSRHLYLFDTFEGMSEPGQTDINAQGKSAAVAYGQAPRLPSGGVDWCYASIDEVRGNLASTQYPAAQFHLVKGRVEETLPAKAPESISILRLDTDWYESSRHEMTHLFPRLQCGGVLILDDYGFWQGCRQAADEFFQDHGIRMHLVRVDGSCRVGVKM